VIYANYNDIFWLFKFSPLVHNLRFKYQDLFKSLNWATLWKMEQVFLTYILTTLSLYVFLSWFEIFLSGNLPACLLWVGGSVSRNNQFWICIMKLNCWLTVYFILVCQMLFCNDFFNPCYFKLKLCQRFYVVRNEIQLDSTNIEKFPHCKNRTLWQHHVYKHDVVKVCDFHNRGLWGKLMSFVRSNWNFVSYYIKNVDIYHVSFS